jgi:hypothetical protein
MDKKKVIIGLSGGVDSAVSAYLLKQQGYEVLGLFMRNWEDDGVCPAAVDFEDVAAVCRVLDIPYYTVNFTQEYQDLVFQDFLRESRSGRTPNPDILCNREIKFKAFFQKAKELGADFLATGHYCQLRHEQGHTCLLKGSDPNKDQSYFLYATEENVLREVLFPIGHLPKTEVRRIAEKARLPVAKKKDSTGICFIGKRNFKGENTTAYPSTPSAKEKALLSAAQELPGLSSAKTPSATSSSLNKAKIIPPCSLALYPPRKPIGSQGISPESSPFAARPRCATASPNNPVTSLPGMDHASMCAFLHPSARSPPASPSYSIKTTCA